MSKKTKSESTALTVVERAALAVRSTPELKQELTTLAEGSKHITTITNADGRAQVHAALMVLKNRRIEIEKIGKDARDDATKFSKAVIAEEDVLVGLLQPEEDRLQAIRDEWDDRIEAEHQAKVKAEQERVAGIHGRIADMRTAVNGAARARSAADVQRIMDDIDAIVIDESFAELMDLAADTKAEVYEVLKQTHASFVAREQEAARLKAEQAERDRQQREREAAERERKNAVECQLEWLRGNPTFTAMSSPTLIQQNIEEIRHAPITEEDYGEFLSQATDRRDATIARLEGLYVSACEYRREQDRQAAESARIQREADELAERQLAEQERRESEERARQEADAQARRDAETEAERQRKANFVPTLEQVCDVLADHYEVTVDRVLEWLPKLVKVTGKKAA